MFPLVFSLVANALMNVRVIKVTPFMSLIMPLKIPNTVLLALHMAKAEIRSRYARSILGSLWITIQQALFVIVVGFVFPAVFGAKVETYLPFFAVSLLYWNFMSSCILESLDSISANAPLIKDRGFDPNIFLLASYFRNILMSAHSIIIPILAILIFQASSPIGFLMSLPGQLLFIVAVGNLAYTVGIIGARYRDIKRLIESVIQIAFLATPILWRPEFIEGRSSFLVEINPLAHMFIAWRQPLLLDTFAWTSFGILTLITLVSTGVAVAMTPKIRNIAIWA